MHHFRAEASKLADQYSAYEPLPGLHINGQQTSTENIADVAGLATAWDAYQLSLRGQPAPVVAGFTAEQRFFLGFAQNYRAKFREAALRRQIVTDILAPAPYRALTVRNLDVWYSTFDVKPGQKLYLAPAERVRIWSRPSSRDRGPDRTATALEPLRLRASACVRIGLDQDRYRSKRP
jgi:putative endopeptidase